MNSDKMPILIVGDWVVDEYWFLVDHHSDLSSHTGLAHFRIASTPGERIYDLCGAGHTARVMLSLQKPRFASEPNLSDFSQALSKYRIVGLGNWNDADTDFLAHLFHSDCELAQAQYHITRTHCNSEPLLDMNSLNPTSATLRIVRLYEQHNNQLRQLNRIDWERRSTEPMTFDRSRFDSFIEKVPSVPFIILHDLQKGTVTRDLVSTLKSAYPQARWFIRSKARNPGWMKILEDVNELTLIGPEVASVYNPIGNLLIGDRVTWRTAEIIQDNPDANRLVILSRREEALAYLKENQQYITCRSINDRMKDYHLGWSSAIFAYLIAAQITTQSITEMHLQEALSYAYDERPGTIPSLRSHDSVNRQSSSTVSKHGKWNAEQDFWQMQSKIQTAEPDRRMGLREEVNELRLELWRGSTDLPGYICCVREKREQIKDVSRALHQVIGSGTLHRHLNILLQADPAAGKTSLARALARAFGLTLVACDITQMMHRDEILDFLDAIATQQASRSELVLAFVDEINAEIEGGYAYSTFLSPLEEGVYIRRGKTFSLRPCIWIFAGTNNGNAAVDRQTSINKYEDFLSRMSVNISLDYKTISEQAVHKHGDEEKQRVKLEAQLEQVYLAGTLIRQYYPAVNRVQRRIMRHFYEYNPEEVPSRRIRKDISFIRNVRYGEIKEDNWSGHLITSDDPHREADQRWIQLVQ